MYMKNVYDIRKEKQLQFVFSTKISSFCLNCKKIQFIAVVVNLFYEEKVEYYCQYLNHLPEDITLYIFSSQGKILLEAKKYLYHKNTIYLEKKNRGRDLSTCLVAFRPYFDKYNLICFLHDKKEHALWHKDDIDKWNENLWSNMIASADYILNILQLFEERPKLGILFPPEPLGEFNVAWFNDSWDENFDHCLELARKMNLSADIRENKPPISLGSVFWARKEVLLKLFDMNWKYEDFPEEPMPINFTISHAVERIFGYLAEDAGFDAGTVMTEEYASWSLLFLQDYVRLMFSELTNRIGIENFNQLRLLFVQEKSILHYIKLHEKFFLFGAGKRGIFLLKLLREKKLYPEGFIVTDGNKHEEFIEELKVYELKDINANSCGIILTVYYPLQNDMINELKKYGIHDFFIVFDQESNLSNDKIII